MIEWQCQLAFEKDLHLYTSDAATDSEVFSPALASTNLGLDGMPRTTALTYSLYGKC